MDEPQDLPSEKPVNFASRMPKNFTISVQGFSDEDSARKLGTVVGDVVRTLGEKFDLIALDGVTVAVDYNQALLDLDRGYETSYKLTATNSHVIGVAMTPSVIREDELKSHIVLNANNIWPLLENDPEGREHAIHILAHECAHVEVTNMFERCFPKVILREQKSTILENLQWKVIFPVWDEFAVTALSAGFGEDQTDAYEETFINDLKKAETLSNDLILAYREHESIDQILGEIYGCWGNVLKFAAYHLGNLAGCGLSWSEREKTMEALSDHWFLPYFERLDEACREILSQYGKWEDKSSFTLISDVVDDLVERAGLIVSDMGNGQFWVDIPYTPETTPS
ncbi:hypothetical protein I4N56_033580 [Pseudomonas mohnii]|uniref:hypothetical protein n=1 Tax=Pseudomonas mohnii TaxID=395600 RepID=UPI0018C6320E|nr:hypothetical protein [Pseudomonas mohnii]MBH8615247.1 hypothetical protein [Pseudomonas mohnii]